MTGKERAPKMILTAKQQHFARCVASGDSYAAAYREAYDCDPDSQQKTQQQAGSRLMAKVEVAARVNMLIKQREAKLQASKLSDRDFVLRKLRGWSDDAIPEDAPRIRAAELLGKTAGMFINVSERRGSRSAVEIQAELDQRIADMSAGAESANSDTGTSSEDGEIGQQLH